MHLAEIGAIAIGDDGQEVATVYPPTVRLASERLHA